MIPQIEFEFKEKYSIINRHQTDKHGKSFKDKEYNV
jgi:hypothetical protein